MTQLNFINISGSQFGACDLLQSFLACVEDAAGSADVPTALQYHMNHLTSVTEASLTTVCHYAGITLFFSRRVNSCFPHILLIWESINKQLDKVKMELYNETHFNQTGPVAESDVQV